ncbi:potassium voltage-gated channel protein Shaw-like [Mizuhopecten yessoensis]|uniref:Potassium voltage-gated channel protein Shaw n=1 Tax=Mizuhopecten yessoensis TaxID=6573 RepID=A0A210PSX0_MIZYE|nr:potassium voltage-gated channel protein Shaw-like [Mizuhopecten yessoensis]OWF39581.1 Potassium voltage-gated channel protein Shaw [Mizuhopecten yessoensis]
MATDANTKDKVKFNLRGVLFETKRCTLCSFPNTLLASLDSNSEYWDEGRGEYFFERDPGVFNSVLNFYIMHALHVPKNICGSVFRKELEFWKIPVSYISECCWKQYYEVDETADINDVLRTTGDEIVPSSKEENVSYDGIRYKTWVALDNPNISKAAMIWNIIYTAVVIVSTLVFFLASLPDHRSELYFSTLQPAYVNYTIPSEKLRIYYMKDMDPGLFVVEYICMVIFTLEFVLYLIVCPCRQEIIRSPMRVITILLIVSMWVTFIFEFHKGKMIESQSTAIIFMVVRFFTVLRVVLILRLERHFRAFRVLLHAIRASLKELFLLYISFSITTVIFACAIFYAEIFYDGTYDNLFIAMWWVIITLTTIGYGDIYPTTTMGYIVGAFCAVCGIVLLALPIAIIAANFAGYYTHNSARMRHLKSVREEAKSATC